MAVITIRKTASLDGVGRPEMLPGVLYADEKLAHRFVITGVRDGGAVGLTGSVIAYFVRSDRQTVALEGECSGGAAVVELARSCYAVEGKFHLTIYVVSGDTQTAVYSAFGTVVNTSTDAIVDPSHIVPDIAEIAEMYADVQTATAAANDAATLATTKAGLADTAATLANTKAGLADTAATLANTKAGLADTAATLANTKAGLADDAATLANTKAGLANTAASSANTAASAANTAAASATSAAATAAAAVSYIAPTYSASATYAVGDYCVYNGGLYRCVTAISTAEAWTAAHWESVTVGSEFGRVDEEMSTKAEVDGYYDELTSGSAEQLIATVETVDKAPYVFRATSGASDVGNRKTELIVGGTVAWNQIATLYATSTVNGITNTNNGDGSVTFSGTTAADNVAFSIAKFDSVANHVYCITATNMGVFKTMTGYMSADSTRAWSPSTTHIGTDGVFRAVLKPTTSALCALAYRCTANGTEVASTTVIPQIYDLTLMFGPTVADAVYAMEQSTAGTGVAWFRAMFPASYYAYNAGELMSVQTAEHVTVGFNQLDIDRGTAVTTGETSNTSPRTFTADQVWIGLSGSNYFSGSYVTAYTIGRDSMSVTVNHANYGLGFPFRAVPGLTYYIGGDLSANAKLTCGFYQADGAFIRYANVPSSNLITAPEGCAWMTVVLAPDTANATVTWSNPCVNLHWTGYRDGDYEAYSEHRYALQDNLTLRGVPVLEDGGLAYDGDTYESDGTVTRRFGAVDLGTLTWAQDSKGYFYANPGGAMGVAHGEIANGVCSLYAPATYTQVCGTTHNDMSFNIASTTKLIYVRDEGKESLTAAEFKTAMSGVMLVYEKATATTETAASYHNPMIVDDFGTEMYVDTRSVPVPVGHVSRYQANLRDKLQHLPSLAAEDGVYLVTQDDGQMTLTPHVGLPTAPTTDGTYVLRATVSGGEVTYSWEAET